jgi:hypothetical protein
LLEAISALEAALSSALCDVVVERVLGLICAWHAQTVPKVKFVSADRAGLAEGARETTKAFTLVRGAIFTITTRN